MLALAIAQAMIGTAPPPLQAVTPTPDFPAFHAIAEAYVRDRLVDPDSAKFRWDPRTFTLVKPVYAGMSFVCGMVNSRNRFGGYDGYKWFFIAEKNGAVAMFDIDSDSDPPPGTTSDATACRNWGFTAVAPYPPTAPPAASP
jgi:hypothetical protein